MYSVNNIIGNRLISQRKEKFRNITVMTRYSVTIIVVYLKGQMEMKNVVQIVKVRRFLYYSAAFIPAMRPVTSADVIL